MLRLERPDSTARILPAGRIRCKESPSPPAGGVRNPSRQALSGFMESEELTTGRIFSILPIIGDVDFLHLRFPGGTSTSFSRSAFIWADRGPAVRRCVWASPARLPPSSRTRTRGTAALARGGVGRQMRVSCSNEFLMNASTHCFPPERARCRCLVSVLLLTAGAAWADLPPGWKHANLLPRPVEPLKRRCAPVSVRWLCKR
jgi:hypothetical protein